MADETPAFEGEHANKGTDREESITTESTMSESIPDGTTTDAIDDVLASARTHSRPLFEDDPLEPPREPTIDETFFEFDSLERYRCEEWTWVNEPYAYLATVFDSSTDEPRLWIVEPHLDQFEQYVRDDLEETLRRELLYADETGKRPSQQVFDEQARDVIQRQATTVSETSLHKILYYLRRDFIGYGTIDPLMRAEAVEDISCSGAEIPLYVYHREHGNVATNRRLGAEQLDSYVLRLAQRAGKHLSVSTPLVDASLPDGSRVQATLGGDVTTRGSNFTIRNFTDTPFTPVELIDVGTFSVEQMAFFWFAVQNNRSLLFAGATGSGKTTSMNSMSFFIPPQSKVVSIEDTPELSLPHDNWIQSVSREPTGDQGRGEVSMYNLLNSSLRQRPEYILVGEIRTDPRVASTFFQAISTGHTAYTTFHANSIQGLLSRMQNEPLGVPGQMLAELDLVSIQKQVRVDGHPVRRNDEIVEIISRNDDPGTLQTRAVFERDPAADRFDRARTSRTLEDIREERGWSSNRVETELRRRREILEYLLANDLDDYDTVVKATTMFARQPDAVVDLVHDDALETRLREAMEEPT
ncbi:type II/IV secretion system ATPase subunit [Natronorubrum sulfidifaciens]|uniref:Type II secretion system protein E n=1 Tax=Natronorubrum sulfidifaciens JCM 14089 TaxID=1230460 RepID=L9VXG3_9EURY|nr:type II/IV secretion system ATPase subunit [Natronorubrum sulfidifaciens]ELY40933.1 type II secretion system protein E [Natronorubrum sulfidifaciens JCM 14089]